MTLYHMPTLLSLCFTFLHLFLFVTCQHYFFVSQLSTLVCIYVCYPHSYIWMSALIYCISPIHTLLLVWHLSTLFYLNISHPNSYICMPLFHTLIVVCIVSTLLYLYVTHQNPLFVRQFSTPLILVCLHSYIWISPVHTPICVFHLYTLS